MNNKSTNLTSTSDGQRKKKYFPMEVLLAVFFIYITLCEVIVVFKQYRAKKLKFQWRNLKFLLNLMLVISVLLADITILGACAGLFVTPLPPTYFMLLSVGNILTYVGLYTTLWLRQRVFYTTESLSYLTTPVTRFLSISEGVIMLVLNLLLLSFMFYWAFQYECTRAKCMPKFAYALFAGTQLQSEITLLALFIHPLVKHIKDVAPQLGVNKTQIQLLKRTVAVTSLAILTDLLGVGVIAVTGETAFIYINIFFNLFCVILTFQDWKIRMMPFVSFDADSNKE